MEKKGFQIPQMGTEQMDHLVGCKTILSRERRGMNGMNPDQLSRKLEVPHRIIVQLSRILETLQDESTDYSGGLPTSFVRAENAIARCISECLRDYPGQKIGTSHIQSLLREHKVVRLLPDGTHSVSLHTVHTILQDNFPNSSLCLLFNILLAGWMGSSTKVIEF